MAGPQRGATSSSRSARSAESSAAGVVSGAGAGQGGGPRILVLLGSSIGTPPPFCLSGRRPRPARLLLHVAAGEDRGHEVEHVGGRLLVVAVVADEPFFDH